MSSLRASIVLAVVLSAAPITHAQVTLTFEDAPSLADYAAIGVHFSDNVTRWLGGPCSVFEDPDCGPVTPPMGVCAGNCGGQTGVISFDAELRSVSIYALSGPGPDNITPGTMIRCFDAAGALLAEAAADTDVQFQLLTVTADGIRRLEISSLQLNNDAWDNLSFFRRCQADWNGDATLNSQDFFDFIGAFFLMSPLSDFNGDAAINSQDFFDFLSAFFNGC